MSTTIKIDKLANYFRQVINGQIIPAYKFNVDDKLFDVQEMYLEHIQNYGILSDLKLNEPRLSKEAIDLCVKLIKSFDDENSMSGWDHTKKFTNSTCNCFSFSTWFIRNSNSTCESIHFPRGKPDS